MQPFQLQRAFDVAVEAEADGAMLATFRFIDRLARQPGAEPSNVHPVPYVKVRCYLLSFHLRGVKYRPGHRRDDVAAGLKVASVYVQCCIRLVIQRPGAPQVCIAHTMGTLPQSLELSGNTAIENYALVRGDQFLYAFVCSNFFFQPSSNFPV